jgi:hypothetical protein
MAGVETIAHGDRGTAEVFRLMKERNFTVSAPPAAQSPVSGSIIALVFFSVIVACPISTYLQMNQLSARYIIALSGSGTGFAQLDNHRKGLRWAFRSNWYNAKSGCGDAGVRNRHQEHGVFP